MSVFGPKTFDIIDAHLDEAFNLQVRSPPRKRTLRCSSLPYCSIIDTITPDEPEYADLSSSLYMEMGTAAHSAIQLFMTMTKLGKYVWGMWKCSQCGHFLKEHQFRPEDCCGVPMIYKEVSLRVGPLTGHIDLTACYPLNGRKVWMCWEFKTIDRKPDKPKRVHQLQIRHYVAMMKLHHGIDVEAYTVVYIGRQYLERWKFGPYNAQGSMQDTRNIIFQAIKGYKSATKARRDPSSENLVEVVENRPCKSIDDWKSYMSRSYSFANCNCPFLSACTRSSKASLRAIENTLNGV